MLTTRYIFRNKVFSKFCIFFLYLLSTNYIHNWKNVTKSVDKDSDPAILEIDKREEKVYIETIYTIQFYCDKRNSSFVDFFSFSLRSYLHIRADTRLSVRIRNRGEHKAN